MLVRRCKLPIVHCSAQDEGAAARDKVKECGGIDAVMADEAMMAEVMLLANSGQQINALLVRRLVAMVLHQCFQ